MKKMFILMVMVLSIALVACGGDDSGSSDGGGESGPSAANGEKLYNETVIGSASAPGCITCHSLEAGVVLVGPSHNGVGSRAASYVAGMSAKDYLRQSIVEPDASIVDGFTAGVMYQNYASELSDSEIDDLVAYLETLK